MAATRAAWSGLSARLVGGEEKQHVGPGHVVIGGVRSQRSEERCKKNEWEFHFSSMDLALGLLKCTGTSFDSFAL